MPAAVDSSATVPVAVAKGFCKKCNNNNHTIGSLTDKESTYSINKQSSPETSFHESEEELEEELEGEEEEEEDAYLEVIDWFK